MPDSVVTHSEDETADVAAALASSLAPGSVVLLSGNLGAGKTAFVRGLARGLGIDEEEVSSPTFTLIHEYRGGRVPLYHVDLYRVDRPREIEDLGLEEMAAGGVMAIEWADKLGRPWPAAIGVSIVDAGNDDRRIEIER